MKKIILFLFVSTISFALSAKDGNSVYSGWFQMLIEGDELKDIVSSSTYMFRVGSYRSEEDFIKQAESWVRGLEYEFRYNTQIKNVIQLVLHSRSGHDDFIFTSDRHVVGKVGFYNESGELVKKYTISFLPTVSSWYLVYTGQIANEVCEFIESGQGCVRFVLPTNMLFTDGISDFDLYVPSFEFYSKLQQKKIYRIKNYNKILDVRL